MLYFSKEADLARSQILQRYIEVFRKCAIINRLPINFDSEELININLHGILYFAGTKSITYKNRDRDYGYIKYNNPDDFDEPIITSFEDIPQYSKNLYELEDYFQDWFILESINKCHSNKEFEIQSKKYEFLKERNVLSSRIIDMLQKNSEKMERKNYESGEKTYLAKKNNDYKIKVAHQKYYQFNASLNNKYSKIYLYLLMLEHDLKNHHKIDDHI